MERNNAPQNNHWTWIVGWVGSITVLLGGLYRPQTSPARPTNQNKSGWLGAVSLYLVQYEVTNSVPIYSEYKLTLAISGQGYCSLLWCAAFMRVSDGVNRTTSDRTTNDHGARHLWIDCTLFESLCKQYEWRGRYIAAFRLTPEGSGDKSQHREWAQLNARRRAGFYRSGVLGT